MTAPIASGERRTQGGGGTAKRLRVLVITRIFPNAVEPLSSPFNRQQFAALGRLCDLSVMATIPWFPGAAFVRKSRSWGLRKVPARDVIEGLQVSHPRVAYVPGVAGLSGALEVASLLPSFLARRHDIDVVLGSWAYPDGAAAVALARLIGVPAVIKAHGSDLNVQSTMLGPRTNLAFALPRASRVVAVSAALGEKAISLGVSRDRVCVVPNGTDASLFRVREQGEARAALVWPASPASSASAWPRRLVLYCGRIERAKGVMDLIEAFSRIAASAPDLSLALLGEGGGMAEAKALAAPLGERIVFLGARKLAEVPLWMGASTLVTLPSHAEGSPNVIREALACGRPVVGTRVGGIPELITGPELGAMVPPSAPEALGEALLDVASREPDPAKIRAQSGGSWEESAAALLAVLKAAHGDSLVDGAEVAKV